MLDTLTENDLLTDLISLHHSNFDYAMIAPKSGRISMSMCPT